MTGTLIAAVEELTVNATYLRLTHWPLRQDGPLTVTRHDVPRLEHRPGYEPDKVTPRPQQAVVSHGLLLRLAGRLQSILADTGERAP
jgi:hypothetical protein